MIACSNIFVSAKYIHLAISIYVYKKLKKRNPKNPKFYQIIVINNHNTWASLQYQ